MATEFFKASFEFHTSVRKVNAPWLDVRRLLALSRLSDQKCQSSSGFTTAWIPCNENIEILFHFAKNKCL